MATPPTAPERPRRRRWNRVVVIEVVAVLVLPLILGVALGWYDLNPSQAEALSSVGSRAHELLDSFPDDRLVIEIDYQTSIGPPPASSISILEERVNETCSKASVSVEEYPFSSSATGFSEGSLLGLEGSVRHTWSTWGTVALDYLYLDGGDTDQPSAIGLAYHGTSIAVFEGTIRSDAPSDAGPVTTTVMVHEFGHELGLVGLIGSAPNEDPNHPYHSNDPNDVMYWAVDSTALFGGLVGSNPPTQFDAADLSDLTTVRSTPIFGEILPWIVLGGVVTTALLIAVWGIRSARGQRGSPPGK